MGCSLKAGVISIAIIFIVLSVLNLGKLSHNLARHHHGGHHHGRHHGGHHDRHHGGHHGHHGHHKHGKHGKHGGHHKHHHHEDRDMTTTNSPHVAQVAYDDGKMLFGRDEKKLAFEREHMMETTAYPKMSDDDFDRKKKCYNKKSTLIIGIVASLITILFSCLVFAAVSDDVGKNQRRRHFLLPFIVWLLLKLVFLIAGGIYVLIKSRDHLPHIGFLLLIIFLFMAVIGVLSTFLHIVVKYFKSLSVSSGFAYGHMVDDDIKKQPLA